MWVAQEIERVSVFFTVLYKQETQKKRRQWDLNSSVKPFFTKKCWMKFDQTIKTTTLRFYNQCELPWCITCKLTKRKLVYLPCFLVTAQVSSQCLLSPLAIHWVTNRCKGWHWLSRVKKFNYLSEGLTLSILRACD